MGQKSPEEQTKGLYEDMKKNYMEKGKKPLILDAFGAPIWDIKKVKGPKQTIFVIAHSAKDVVYDMSNFIERNADKISKSLAELLEAQADTKDVSKIFAMRAGDAPPETDEKDGKKKGPTLKTIWGKFDVQIKNLMDELAEPLIPQDLGDDSGAAAKKPDTKKKKADEEECEETDLHFIRCLKPNDLKVPQVFHHAMTLQQITYMGVLESIRVKQENFPYRYKYEDFYRTYELLSREYAAGRYDLMDEATKASKQQLWRGYCEQILADVFCEF